LLEAMQKCNRSVSLRTRTRHLIGGGRLPVAPGIAAVDQARDETAGAERRSHTEQHGRDCRSGPAMSTHAVADGLIG
jgi:hypothetical protein